MDDENGSSTNSWLNQSTSGYRSPKTLSLRQLRERGPLFSSLEELRDKLTELLGNSRLLYIFRILSTLTVLLMALRVSLKLLNHFISKERLPKSRFSLSISYRTRKFSPSSVNTLFLSKHQKASKISLPQRLVINSHVAPLYPCIIACTPSV